MQVTVKFFASLKELTGLTELTVEQNGDATVQDIWDRATGHRPMPANTLCSINMDYARADERVQEGDEVAFFPPVTGGRA